ncbi:Pentatricopeptide repeat-containing protein, mitochondrial [Ananas comosus]|uniref:Pentatricopeptide repeat-containing protein, mitochondrial n=1 Tax=Ananas comosus TaxID=4615 RepID=A0A199W9I2_ANACO|nr:Pentatricopeptide repeat-containing protein, mitochondrial [Ananas comosus]
MLGHCLLTTLRAFNCRRPRSLLLHHHHHPTLSSSSSSSTQCPNPSMALPSPQNPTQRISSAAELKLIHRHCRAGQVATARHLFDEMPERNVVTYSTMIYGYATNGRFSQCARLFARMIERGVPPNSFTMVAVLVGAVGLGDTSFAGSVHGRIVKGGHSGLVDEGLIIFRKMIKEKGIKMRGEHVGCMVDMLARAGRLDDARELISAIQDDANLNALKALLRGCYLYGNINLVEDVGQKVLQTESSDFGNAVLVSNAYASFGKFEVVESLRSNLEKKGPTKNLGLSLLDSMAREVEVS